MGRFTDWLGLTVRDDAPAEPPAIPSREVSGAFVSSTDALSLGAVYRAVSIRATAIKQLSVDLWRGEQRVEVLPLWLRRPDIGTSWRVFLEQTVVSLNLNGNAYWRIRRNDDRTIRSLEVLNPLDVQIRQSESQRVIGYSYRAYDLRLDEVQHLARLRVPGNPTGLGPIQAARAELRGAIDLRDYSANWFRDTDTPSGILAADSPLTAEQAKQTKEAWRESRGGKREVAVLGGGVKYSHVALSPEDAQWLESRKFSTTEIARLFGIPASLLLASVEGSSLTYSNVAQVWVEFIRFGLSEDVLEIEDAITELLPRTTTARLNVEALLRADTASRYAAHAAGITAGWLLPSEVRDIEGLPPVDGIDERPRPKEAAA